MAHQSDSIQQPTSFFMLHHFDFPDFTSVLDDPLQVLNLGFSHVQIFSLSIAGTIPPLPHMSS
jgi:hypothetical protein